MALATALVRDLRKLALWRVLLVALLGAGCGDARLTFIAGAFSETIRDAGEDANLDAGEGANLDEGPDAGLDAGEEASLDTGQDASLDAGLVVVGTTSARGRVRVTGTTLVTDRGTLLRGADIPIDLTPDFPLSPQLFQDMALAHGLNAVEVYLEYWADVSGVHIAQADQIVDGARAAGLYVILGIGGGPPGDGHLGNGWFDIQKIRSFWQIYAPRYKDQTHVIYQIQNQPDLSCDAPWPANTIAMEREAYSLIRSFAPDTHIILFSYREMPTPSLLRSNIDQVSDLVDWSNASVGAGGITNCVTAAQFANTFAAATNRRAPMFITALPIDETFVEEVLQLERDRLGWMSIRWLVRLHDFGAFRSEHSQTGVSWCPDFGTWPQDSQSCRGR
jgi:hypothetical protein